MNAPSPHPLDDTIASLVLDTSPYLSCDECFQRLDVYAEARARDPHHHDPAMESHLRGCPACADEASALLDLIAPGTP